MSKRSLSRVPLAVLLLAIAPPAFAQSAGSLRGTVSDKTGGVLPGATVVLTNEATRFAREATTDSQGGYFFASVDPGSYGLKVTLPSFKAYEAKAVRISANDTVGLDVALEVGVQTETVVVTAERALIQSETGAREGLITPEQIESLSILGRNPLELLRTLPGVVAPEQGSFERQGISSGFGGAGDAFSINGTRPENLGVTLDGANLRDIGNNSGMMNVPNNEFVAEVKVQMSNYAAEFGTAAVNVQAVTKSGSSEFHGSAYDYLRHHKFAANERARSYAGQDKPKERFQYPGFTLSGPLLIPGTDFNKNRDKAFFFIGWEWNFQTLAPDPIFGVVPTDGMRRGLFNDFLGGSSLDQPTTVNIPRGFPGAGTPAPNNDLRPYIDPIGQALMNLYPRANYQDPNNRYNYIFDRTVEANRNQGVVRLDYNINENTRTYIRLARDSETNENLRGLWWQASGVELPTPIQGTGVGQSAVVNLTSVLSPSATNEVLFTWSELKNDNRYQDPSKAQLSSYGINALRNPFGGPGTIPDLVMEFASNRGSLWYWQDVENVFSYNGFIRGGDNFTKVLNTHAIKIGGIVERQYKKQNFNNPSNIQLNFARWGFGGTGSEFGNLLTGRPAQATIARPAGTGNFVAWNFELFAQDSWKVSRNFTFEYGVRLGKWTNSAESGDQGAVFLRERYDRSQGFFVGPDRLANGFVYASKGEVGAGLTDSRPLLVMPRLNFAWDVRGDGNTVLRGGAGLFYNREQGNAQYGVLRLPPLSYSTTLNADSLQDLGGGRGLDYTTIGSVDPFRSLSTPGDVTSVNPENLRWPHAYQVSTSLARRIPWSQTLEVGYVGTFGRSLAAQTNINAIPEGGLNSAFPDPVVRMALTDDAVNARRPFPAYGNLFYLDNIGRTNYHALQTTLGRDKGRFTYLLAYTLSRARGTRTNDFAVIDPLDPGRADGLLSTDRTHIGTLSWTWRLGESSKGGLAGLLLNGWNLSGVSNYLSGMPIRLGFGGDIALNGSARAWWGTHDHANFDAGGSDQGGGDITPVFTCDPRLGGSKVGDKYLDIDCIGIPGFGQTGPFQQPYNLRSPARNFHDLTLFKDFNIRGSRRLQLRMGAFNVFNQAFPQFRPNIDLDLALDTVCNVKVNNVPNGSGSTSNDICDPARGYRFTENTLRNFGRIITKRGHRVIEFALRLFF